MSDSTVNSVETDETACMGHGYSAQIIIHHQCSQASNTNITLEREKEKETPMKLFFAIALAIKIEVNMEV